LQLFPRQVKDGLTSRRLVTQPKPRPRLPPLQVRLEILGRKRLRVNMRLLHRWRVAATMRLAEMMDSTRGYVNMVVAVGEVVSVVRDEVVAVMGAIVAGEDSTVSEVIMEVKAEKADIVVVGEEANEAVIEVVAVVGVRKLLPTNPLSSRLELE